MDHRRPNPICLIDARAETKGDDQWVLAVRGSPGVDCASPVQAFHDDVKACDLPLLGLHETQERRIVAPFAVRSFEENRAGEASLAETDLGLLDLLGLPPDEAADGAVIQVAACDPPRQALGQNTSDERFVLVLPDPQMVASD